MPDDLVLPSQGLAFVALQRSSPLVFLYVAFLGILSITGN